MRIAKTCLKTRGFGADEETWIWKIRTNWGVLSSFYTVITAHAHKVPCLLLAIQACKDINQLLVQHFLQAYEGFFAVCCIERELVNEARFTDTPFLFPFEG